MLQSEQDLTKKINKRAFVNVFWDVFDRGQTRKKIRKNKKSTSEQRGRLKVVDEKEM